MTPALPPTSLPFPLHPLTLRRTLADIIMEKLTEKQTEVETVMSEATGFPVPQLDPRVLEVYRGVREVRAGTPSRAVGPSCGFGCSHGIHRRLVAKTVLSQSVWVQSPAVPLSDLGAVASFLTLWFQFPCLESEDGNSISFYGGREDRVSEYVASTWQAVHKYVLTAMRVLLAHPPRYYLSTAVGSCPRHLRSSLRSPTGSRSSTSRSPRPGLLLPCTKPQGRVDGG